MATPSHRVEQEELRARMRAVGMSHDEIAIEFARRYHYRLRAAHRVAHGWTQQQAANHINAHAARTGLDPQGTAPMTAPRLSELENWPLPNNRRRPTPQLLAQLAEVYDTSIHNLIDLDDREHLTPADTLLIAQIRKGLPQPTQDGSAPDATAISSRGPQIDLPRIGRSRVPAVPIGVCGAVPTEIDPGADIDADTALRRAHEWLVTEPPQAVETRTGRRIGEAFTRKVEGRVAQLRRLDDFVGGRDLYELVAREVAATTAVLDDAAYDEHLGRRLRSAVAELCQLAGWVAMDAGHTQAARRFYLDGVKAAHAAGNSPVAANLISTLSYQFANQHDPRTAILLARTALRGAENSATPATLALLYERIAWAHAKAGDRSATEKALAAVERHYDQRRPDDEPTWVYWLDDNEIQVMAGRCYVELGLPQHAEPLLVDAVARCDEDHAREAALYRSWLAEAYLQTGDIGRAVEEATHVVRLDARAGSARTSDRVQHLRAGLAAFRTDPAVRAFEDLYQSEADLPSNLRRPN
ncbi:hypothetical protein Franean1_2638 [Parafrankia sp. EAN1pec]|uniref:helix-turn-helix domain-containing protein n=1 Tax=Parafrankia sp. (strain EAN1pec) TaxID=298653 RepID=UPI00005401F8|nr:hypothetical protein Franean1_2638 [Frankia sp. EAN1pec]